MTGTHRRTRQVYSRAHRLGGCGCRGSTGRDGIFALTQPRRPSPVSRMCVIFATWIVGEMESSATMPAGALTGPQMTIPDGLVAVVPELGVPVLAGTLSRSTVCWGPDTASWRPSGPRGRASLRMLAQTAELGNAACVRYDQASVSGVPGERQADARMNAGW